MQIDELNNAMKTKYLCVKAFRDLKTSGLKCFYISRIARAKIRGPFKSAEGYSVAKLVTSASKVVQLLDDECEAILDEAMEKMNIDKADVFDRLFPEHLSDGPLRTALREKYLEGRCDEELLSWDNSSTMPMSVKKFVGAMEVFVKNKVDLRQAANHKMANLAQMQSFKKVRLDSCASHSSYRV